MSEPALDRPGVVPLVGERVAAGVAEHVRMRLEFEISGDCPRSIMGAKPEPSALLRALILVEKPPRERPSALRTVPPFHRQRSDVRG
jgi:hypothetical protein